ncbi:MAG TPA: MBL fold metallo-hydrolase [Casimicrobiaceae bacterium]
MSNRFQRCIAAAAMAAFAIAPAAAQSPAPAASEAPRLVLLGTKGGPSFRAHSAVPTSHVLIVRGVPYVVDTGYGVTRHLLQAGVQLNALRYVFITHHHSDHNLEYGNLLYTAWANGLKSRVDAYGPPGLVDMTRDVMAANRLDIETRIADEGRGDLRKLVFAHEIGEGVIFQDDNVKVTALRNHHPPIVDSYAFKFETQGRTIVFSGDTSYFPPLAEFAKGADVLIHEVMYGPGIEALARRIANGETLLKHLRDSHTLAEDVGRIAKAAGVKTLVLSHFVPGDDPSITRETWERAVRTSFDGRIVVGADLMEIPL